MANYSNEGNNMSPRIEIDEHYGCIRVDGVLCPDPISFALPLSSSSSVPPPPAQQQNRAKNTNRILTESKVLEWGDVHVKLLQCLDDQTYVLELREVNNANGRAETTFHSLSPGIMKEGKRRVLSREDGSLGEKMLFPVTEEVFSDVDLTKHNLTMRERLNGEWAYEIRERRRNKKVEKFYYHSTVSKTIRSANDIATFIMYAD